MDINFGVKKRKFLAFVLLLLFVLACANGVWAAAKVPDFSLPSVGSNENVDIRDFRGKIVLINFWATWCGPCVIEIPSLASLQDEFGPQGFSVIGISIDKGGTAMVKRMMQKTGVNYPVAIDNNTLSNAFGGVFGVPTSFLIDRSGNVLKRYTGYVGHQVFAEDIRKAIK